MLTGGSRPFAGAACWLLQQALAGPAKVIRPSLTCIGAISSCFSRSLAAQAAPAADHADSNSSISPDLDNALLPKIALVGRPNVGKSALFNRLAGRRLSLVHDTPASHVTRDWREARGHLADLQFTIIDTCGVEPTAPKHTIQARGTELTASMLQSVHLALMVIDARTGVLGPDEELAHWLTRQYPAQQVVLVANKAESNKAQKAMEQTEADAYRLGFGTPVAISAATGEGLSDLYAALQPRVDAIREQLMLNHGQLPDAQQAEDHPPLQSMPVAPVVSKSEKGDDASNNGDDEQDGAQPLRLAIMGLPNVGKSTLLNQLLGEQRVVTGPEPGLTRDPVAVYIQHNHKRIQLVDTAGYFGQTKMAQFDDVGGEVATRARAQALRSLASSTVVALVLDAAEALRTQQVLSARELSLVCQVVATGRCLVVVANKMDALSGQKERALYLRSLRGHLADRLQDAGVVQVVHMSAALGQNVQQLLPAVVQAYEHWSARLSTSQLNKWLRQQLLPGFKSGGGIAKDVSRIKYITQVQVGPPTLVCMVAGTQPVPQNVQAFLAGELRSEFNIPGTPIRFWFRHREFTRAGRPGQRRIRLRRPALPPRKSRAANKQHSTSDDTGLTAGEVMQQRAAAARAERTGVKPLPDQGVNMPHRGSQHAGSRRPTALPQHSPSSMHRKRSHDMQVAASDLPSGRGPAPSRRPSSEGSRVIGRQLLSDQVREWQQRHASAR